MSQTAAPDAPARLDGPHWIIDCCPHCGGEHRHGSGGGADPHEFLGHRWAHCYVPGSEVGYRLVEALA